MTLAGFTSDGRRPGAPGFADVGVVSTVQRAGDHRADLITALKGGSLTLVDGLRQVDAVDVLHDDQVSVIDSQINPGGLGRLQEAQETCLITHTLDEHLLSAWSWSTIFTATVRKALLGCEIGLVDGPKCTGANGLCWGHAQGLTR